MGSSEEMYALGVRDAEQDSLNLFYYQHYYHYRRGYDRARRNLHKADVSPRMVLMRWLPLVSVVLVGALLLVGGAFVFSHFSEANGPAASQPATSLSQTRTAALPTPTPSPTPTPLPTPTPEPVLHPGGKSRVVNIGSAALRARANPGLGQRVQASFSEGSQVTIVEGPVEADGYTWWRIEGEEGAGWCAEGNPEGGTTWLEPLPDEPPADDTTTTNDQPSAPSESDAAD
jgi:hypothetical protein